MTQHKDLTGADLHVNKLHAPTHENDGSDEISLTGLAGSPALGSATTAVTQSVADNSTKVATTAYADAAAAAAAGTYTDEKAQDAVGAMVDSTLVYTDATPLLSRAALTGDVTASAGSNSLTLATSGVSAATYGSATQVAQVAFDAKGRATSASSVSIAIAASQVTSGVFAIGRLATGTPDGTKFVRDDGTLATPSGGGGGGGAGGAEVCCGRLTLESGVAISTSDQTGKTTIYWTPYKGANIALYDGSAWNVRAFSETSLALGTLTSGKNYDVFGYDNSGSLALELSAAWSSDTARTDALALQNGVLVKSGTTTRRYLGTFRTTSTTATEDSGGGGTTQVGGKRFVWNYYNRVRRDLSVIDTTDSWTYTTGTIRQANAASGNKVELVIGVNEDAVLASATSSTLSSGSSVQSRTGVGLDSTTAITGIVGSASTNGLVHQTITGFLSKTVGIGYHYLAWLESGNGSSSTWYGDNAGASQSGLTTNVLG